MKALVTIFLNALSLSIGAWLLDGVVVDNIFWAIMAGVILGLANLTVKPILTIITIPVTIVTLGLFLLVVNAFVILFVDWLTPGFEVDGFIWAFILGLILAALNLIYSAFDLK